MVVLEGGYKDKTEKLKEERKKKEECYRGMYYESLYCEGMQDLKKTVFCGMRYIVFKDINTESSYKDLYLFLLEMNEITHLAEGLTYRELCQIFPVGKDFDGWKYESKDYWSSMEYLSTKDMDSAVGDGIDEFFWNYYNTDIINVGVKKLLVFDRIRRMDGAQGLLEGFLDIVDKKHQVHTYTIHEKEGYIYDQMTGKTSKLVKPKKRKPPYLSVV